MRAFGTVLSEMLTGQRACDAEDMTMCWARWLDELKKMNVWK